MNKAKPTSLSPEQREFILSAREYLEHPTWVMRATQWLGQPIEVLQKKLPAKVQKSVSAATDKALRSALRVCLKTVEPEVKQHDFSQALKNTQKSHWLHTGSAAMTGAVGGFFGVMALPLELPLTTGLILRSIIESGRSFNFDVNDPEFQLECLYIFALGSSSPHDDAAETAYYASRLGFSQLLQEATRFIVSNSAKTVIQGLDKGTAPILVRFVATVASRFEVAVSEKVLLEAIPIVGALGGAAINSAFADHFSKAAKFHFGLRHLEKQFGEGRIRRIYEGVEFSDETP